jgi:TolB protein
MIDPPEDLGRTPEPEPGSGQLLGSGSEPDVATEADVETEADVATGAKRGRLRAAVALTLVAAIVIFGALGGARLVHVSDNDQPPATHPPRLAAVDANGALATMDGVGGSVVPYPVPDVAFEFPVWSPDGTHLAAIGRSQAGVGVYVFAAPANGAKRGDGTTDAASAAATTDGDPAVIYQSADRAPFYLYWAPDSRRLAFLATEPVGISLRIAPADGSAADAVVRHGAPLYWDWVDPARLLAHIGGDAPDAFVGEFALDGASGDASGNAPSLTNTLGAFRSPAVSRDGRYRAFVEATADSTQQLVVEARDGSNNHTLAVAGATALGFDPTGTSLAYVAPDSSDTQPPTLPIGPLRLVDATSGVSRLLLGGKVVAFFWAPDGKTIATLGVAGPGNDGVQAATTQVVPAVARLAAPRTLRPDAIGAAAGVGVHLAFIDVATATIRAQQDVRISDLFTNQVLPFFDQYALSHRFWSGDGTAIALPLVAADGTDQLVVIPGDGSASHSIADRVIGFWSP